MLKFYSLAVVAVLGLILPASLYSRADMLKFAWPNGAAAKVHVRSEGRRVSTSNTITWDMSVDFTMQVKRINDRIVVSRANFSGWKGTLPRSFGGGAERFVDMVPTVIATESGVFVGIEGHETTRKLMNESVAQSGGLPSLERKPFETATSNAALEAIAKAHWSSLVYLWQDVELNPEISYELRSVAQVPQFGGGEIEVNGTVQFIKETPCELTRNDKRCVHLHAETAANKEQMRKIIESLLQKADPGPATITAFDQQFKADIVVEKTTMLPQHLKITRINSMTVNDKRSGTESTSEEYSATYTFTWQSAPENVNSSAGDRAQSSAPDFSRVTSKEAVMKLASEGKLVKMLMMPAELSGTDIPENVIYVPPAVLERQKQVTDRIIALVKEGLDIKLRVMPEYKGNSFVPSKIHIAASHPEKRGNFEQTIDIW